MRYVFRVFEVIILLLAAIIAGTVAFDRPKQPQPPLSISRPFQDVDFSDLPPVLPYTARDGTKLAYRRYAGDPDHLAILIHGSAGSSAGMHAVVEALVPAGATVIVPDMRGHGQSGPHGDIAYVGQLEDDLEDLTNSLNQTHAAHETTLIGFSSGGGFVLRVAGGRLGSRFNRYMLLAPVLRYDAPNARVGTGSSCWTSVAVLRIVALSLINRFGITIFNGLPVLAFGLPTDNPDHFTATYSYRLLTNFQPDDDYQGDLRRTTRPIMAIDGADDEIFLSDKLQAALAAGKPGIRVDIVPGVGHIGLTTTPDGTAAIAKAWSSHF